MDLEENNITINTTLNDETRKRRRMDTFGLKKKTTNSQYIMSLDGGYPYRIIRRGLDVTPKTYNLPGVTYPSKKAISVWMKRFTDVASEIYQSEEESDKESVILGSEDFMEMINEMGPVKRLDFWCFQSEPDEWENKTNTIDKAPSMFYIREDPPRPIVVPQENYSIRLQETSTLDLLEVQTRLVKKGGEEDINATALSEKQKQKKEKYDLSIIVPYNEEFTQTFEKPLVDNWCGIRSTPRVNTCIDVYVSDRIKTFLELGIYDSVSARRTKLVSFFEPLQQMKKQERAEETNMYSEFNEEKKTPEEMAWLESLDFFKGISIMERMLSSNLSMKLQLLYHERLYANEPVGDFKYLPQLLWVLRTPKVFEKAVTSISWNSVVPELFAVSYGKYLLSTETRGVICIWNIKNTEYPERMSIFDEPATYVEFSQRTPRILSVAFWNGSVALMDGVLKEPEVLVKVGSELGSLLPVYQFKWLQLDDTETLISCGENGEIHVFKQNLKFKHKMIMKLRSLGKTVNQGVDASQKRPVNDCNPIGPAATTICQHPTINYIYLVGSDNGSVYVCSLFRHNKHMGVFVAHSSAVTSIQFNPVEKKIFLTSGCDFYIRVWIYGNFETYLFQFKNRLAYIDYAVWNPVHPYMIVSVVKHYIEVWHIKENQYEPIAISENPDKTRNLIVSFNPTGANFLVGDMKGSVYVYSFTSIPKPPKDPLTKLADAIIHALESDKERLKLLENTLGYNFSLRN